MRDSQSVFAAAKSATMQVVQAEPLNAGTPLDELVDAYIQPNSQFFVRTHGTVPTLDPETTSITIHGLIDEPWSISVGEIKQQLPYVEQVATLQCAGNRRQEMHAYKAIYGELPWGANGLSTATWGGAPLRALLERCAIQPAAKHLLGVSYDQVERHGQSFGFGGSIPLDEPMIEHALLAYTMNGEALPALHGGPLRLVIPGIVGARSIKWLRSLEFSAEPSHNYFQRRAYRLAQSNEPEAWHEAPMLHELPVNAVVCQPAPEQALAAGAITLAGYAITGGQALIERVEISFDQGQHWQTASLIDEPKLGCWSRWQAELELAAGDYECWVRATDTLGQQQPDQPAWNVKGYHHNAIQRLDLSVC
ncbi:sulfite oxidase [Herpetosiphon sp. NSE202]|uniref:sulfite oxidase n=1 Tax=Herpetosiphon sp. NSE202 TaxID=3351349 RepID=UPI00362B6131